RSTVDRLPDVGLEGRDSLAPREVAQVYGVRLIGSEAIVAAARISRRDLLPGGAAVRRAVGDRAATRGRVVQDALRIGHDRWLSAVGADIGYLVRRRTGGACADTPDNDSNQKSCGCHHGRDAFH